MISNIKKCDIYESIILKKNINRKQIEKALDTVKKYIIKNKLILTGGMAIDLALKEKGSGIYDKDVMPDYDFYSSDYHNTAYELGKILCKLGLENISIINALHSTTMRIRVQFVAVADITYIPKNIYDKISTINTKDGFLIVHPHFKMINIHRALSYPFQDSPYEVILHRYKKDITRFDLLYENYPVHKIKFNKPKIIKRVIDISLLKENCLSGFDALYLWMEYSKKNKFKEFKSDKITVNVPQSSVLSIISNNVVKLEKKILNIYKKQNSKFNVRYYNSILENIPSKTIITLKTYDIEILDNKNSLINATPNENKINKFHIVNLQFIMNYFLLNYILSKDKRDKFLWGYNECYNLIKKQSNFEGNKLFPNIDIYGDSNISKVDIVNERKILCELGENKRENNRPPNIYPKLEENCIIPNKVKYFDIQKSWIYDIDGLEKI